MNDLTYTLPSDWYWNKEVYLKEREKIFSKQWMLVGQIENLQNVGDYITDIIGRMDSYTFILSLDLLFLRLSKKLKV